MTPTVYITNKSSTHDYSSALRYGAMRFVTTGNYPIFKTARLQEEIIEALINSSPEDYLLLSGSSAVAAMCVLVWFQMHSVAKILLWDRTQQVYVLRALDRSTIRVEIESVKDRVQGGAGRMVR